MDVSNPVYSSVDGVLFNKSQTTLINCPNGKNAGWGRNYTIPDSVTTIGDNAFRNLSSVTIPASVTAIGDYAFSGCRYLYFKGNAPSVGLSYSESGYVYYLPGTTGWGESFGGYPTRIWPPIPYTYTTADNGTITITGYTDPGGAVTIPSTIDGKPVTKIGNFAFSSCYRLSSVTIPDSVTSIGTWAFNYCTNLTSVTIGDSVTGIGDEFLFCDNLTSVTIGKGVTSIEDYFEGGCFLLNTITVDSLNSTYSSVDGVLFNKSQTRLIKCPKGKAGSVTIPNSVTSIEDYAFGSCISLTSVTIPDSVTSIGAGAFVDCSGLSTVHFHGNSPSVGLSIYNVNGKLFEGNKKLIVYYLPWTTGWGTTFGGRPTKWEPGTYRINNGVPLIGLKASKGTTMTCGITVPANQNLLEIKISGLIGDCDFDVVQPDGTIIRRSVSGSSNELVQISGNPLATGNWLIKLYGQTDYSGLNLFAKYSKLTAVPAAPTGVSASDGLFPDKIVVTWSASSGATSYVVGRNTVNATAGANWTILGETADCIFEDNSQTLQAASPGALFYYFVLAKNPVGTGNYGTGNSGYRTKIPANPTTVTASDGMYFDRIRVTWSKLADATSYLIFRTENTSAPNPATDTPLVEISSLNNQSAAAFTYDDFGSASLVPLNGIAPKLYYYWLVGKNENGLSAISKCDSGFLYSKGPATVTATAGTLFGKVRITWTAVAGATGYDVYRYTNKLCTLGGKVFDAGANLSYDDTDAAIGTYAIPYYYKVKAKYNAYYTSSFNLTAAAGYHKAMPGPSVAASAGTCFGKIRVTWTAVAGATGYEVYRYTDKLCQTAPTVFDPGANLFLDDTSASVQTPTTNDNIYYYKVRGKYLSCTTDFNLTPAAGYHKAMPGPVSVTASAGTYFGKVRVSWTAVNGATSYDVYRYTDALCSQNQTIFNAGANLFYEDTGAAPWPTIYYYKVKAKYLTCMTNFSPVASGYHKSVTGPATVTASAGTYFLKVRVTWSAVLGAASYDVYRYTDKLCTTGETVFSAGAGLVYDDFAAANWTTYYYKVRAKFGTYTGNPNLLAATGYTATTVTSLAAPVLSASKDLYPHVKLSWTEIPLAENYIIYRSTTNVFASATTLELTRVTGLTCDDTSAVRGALYYYWIKSNNSKWSVTSLASAAVQGRASGTNTAIIDGDTKNISGGKDSCVYYSIDVPPGKTRLVATLTGTTSLTANDCDLYAKFGALPTTVSYNGKGIENTAGEVLTVSNPASGTWYLMLYGVTDYTNVTLTVNCYSVTDIVLTQVPLNDQTVPFTTNFKGRVVDETGLTGISGLAIQVRNPITGITSMLSSKTDSSGFFTYSTTVNTEGEHTFDFFFTDMPDTAKGTASHTVATRKGCLETNNYFDFSAYLPAAPVSLTQPDVVGLQDFLDIRNGWDAIGTVAPGDTYETMWVNSTLVKAGDDAQLLGKLDSGLYMYFYGIEGAGVGNDTTANSALSAVPFVVHVNSSTGSTLSTVVTNLNNLGIIDDTQKAAILAGKIGIVAVVALSNPDEAINSNYDISLLAREQLEILAKLAGNSGTSGITNVKYSDVTAKQITVTLANGRKINVVAAAFIK